jgi:hypothetical protein
MSPQEFDKRLREDFTFFLAVIWKYLNLPAPTWIQKDIAAYLQHGPERLIIMAFRGVGKSFVTSAFVLWLLYRNPQLKIMVVSASKERADSFSTFTRRLIDEVPFLNVLAPRAEQRDSKISFDVGPATADHSPSVKSVGITGQITGSRADVIIADDVEVLNNSATQGARDKLAELVKEFDAVIKPLKTSRIIYLGTPQCEMSLYNTLVERGYKRRIWPAKFIDDTEAARYKGDIAPVIMDKYFQDQSIVGQTTEPRRFSDEDLDKRLLSYGKAGFALQFMLDTSLSDADKYPLKLADLMVMSLDGRKAPVDFTWASGPQQVADLPTVGLQGDRYHYPLWYAPETVEYQGTVMFIDPSGRGKDETAYAVVKFLHGYLFCTALGGFRDGYSETTLEQLAKIAKTHSVKAIRVESNFGDGMFSELFKPYLRRIHNCEIEEERSVGQKELRVIDTLEPVLMQHRLIIDTRVVEEDYRTAEHDLKYSAFYQLARITRDRGALAHDDRLEALAGAVAYWVEQMALDGKVEAEKHRQELLDRELEGFMDSVFGKGRSASSSDWLSLGDPF